MRRIAVAAGMLILTAAWFAPLSRESFTAHMTVHMSVVAIAAPLLAVGAGRFSTSMSPVLASVFELAVVWLWHTPALHHAARHSTEAYIAEQGTFLLSGLILWIAVLHRRAEGIVALLLTAMHMTLLGAIFVISPRTLYTHSTNIEDQHLGGAVMLIVGGASYLAGGLYLAAGILRNQSRTPQPPLPPPSDPALPSLH
jgi:putative membrane protein